MAVSEEEIKKAREAAELTEDDMNNRQTLDREGDASVAISHLDDRDENASLSADERVESAISEARGHIARNENPDLLRSGSAERLSAERPEPTAYDSLITGRDGVGPNGSHLKSVGDAADGGGIVVGTGMRLVDDPEWHKRYEAMVARKRAERAGLKAQSLARQELLDTGRYFVDAGGNVKLKKKFREIQRMDNTRRGWHKDVKADDGVGMRYIQKAGRDAYSGSMGGWQQALNAQNAEKQNSVRNEFEAYAARNKAAMEKREEDKELQKKRNASDNWVLTSGIFAALNDLQNGPAGTKDRITDEEVDDKSKPAKRQAITDSKGAIMGYKDVYEKKNVGKIKNGYLDPSEVDMINRQLEANGNKKWRLKGVVAQQRFDPKLGNENSDTARKGKPYVLVNIEMKDPQTGEWKPASRYMTMDTLYKFGVDNGKDSGRADAEDIIAEKLGDPNGYLKRKKEAAAHELELARIKAGEGRAAITAKGNAEVANINAQGKRDTAAINAAAKGAVASERPANGDKFDKDRYNALKEWYDSFTMDDDGNPRKLSDEDKGIAKTIKATMQKMLLGGAGGRQGAESAAGGADAVQTATGNSVIDAKRNELIRRGVLNPDGTPRTDGVSQAHAAQGQQAQAQQPPVTGNAQQTNTQNVGKQSGAAIVEQFGKKGETANATSQANNEKQSGSGKEQDIDLSDVQESVDRIYSGESDVVDDVYRSVPREIIKRVKDATGASDEEIMSGKYDRQIEALGARVGNDSAKNLSDRKKVAERNVEAIKGKRKAEAKQEDFRKRQMAFTSDRKDMEKKARDEAKKYGVAHGYDDSQIEKRASTSIRRGLIELRDKYGLAADGSQDYMVSKK